MKEIELRNVKGCVDYSPREQYIRNYISDTLKKVFEKYGFKPLQTPLLCYYDLLALKYDEENDILKEVYKISDIQKLINLALEKSSIEIAYDNFCQLFEQALECVFFQKDFVDKSSKNDDKYLLKTVLLSCAYSIYTKEEINKN